MGAIGNVMAATTCFAVARSPTRAVERALRGRSSVMEEFGAGIA